MRSPGASMWSRKSNTCLNLAMRLFSADLAQAQQEWSATYQQLRDLERSDRNVNERHQR